MGKQNKLQTKIHEEIERFLKTLEELQVLKTASNDLKNYKRMMQLRKHDWSFAENFAPKQTQTNLWYPMKMI